MESIYFTKLDGYCGRVARVARVAYHTDPPRRFCGQVYHLRPITVIPQPTFLKLNINTIIVTIFEYADIY